MYNRIGISLLFTIVVSIAILPSAFAIDEDDKKRIPLKVPKINSDVIMDGSINDPLWQQALKFEIG